MARFKSDSQAMALGEALAAIRRARGLSQAEAGARLDMTGQGWGLYESGRRPGLFRPDVQRRLTAALDATPEDLALHLARTSPTPAEPVSAQGVEAGGRAFRDPPQPQAQPLRRLMQLTGDDMAPWAAAGVVVEYEAGRTPREGQGCVVHLSDGRALVRLYVGEDEAGVRLSRPGEPAETVAREAIRTLSAVTARRERE